MGLQELARKGAELGIKLAGNIARDITYFSRVGQVFDPSTGTNSSGAGQQDMSVVFASYSNMEIDGTSILPQDRKILIPKNSLYFAPSANDEIREITEDNEQKIWQVITFKTDPAEALWVIQVRR